MKALAAPARIGAAVVLTILAGLVVLAGQSAQPVDVLRPASAGTTIFESTPQQARVFRAHRQWELGLRFQTLRPGSVTTMRFYRAGRDQTSHIGSMWSLKGQLLGQVTFPASTTRGWQEAAFATPVPVRAGRKYVASYGVREGDHFAVRPQEFLRGPISRDPLTALTGVWGELGGYPYRDGPRSNYLVDVRFVEEGETSSSPSSSPTTPTTPTTTTTATTAITSAAPTTAAPTSQAPTATAPPTTAAPTSQAPTTAAPTTAPPTTTPPTTPPTSGFPDASSTGVPDGTTLRRYTGDCTIQTTVRLDAVDATACGALLIRAPGVQITNSLLPRVDLTEGGSESVTITDSTIRGGEWSDGAVWGYNFSLLRTEVTGGQHNVHCADNCTVVDSWLHDQYNPDGESYHNNAFLTNGGSDMVLRHNTLHCTATLNSTDGGCTSNVSLFGDFDPVSNVLVENNFLRANNSSISYCAYGGYQPTKQFPIATGIRYVDNVFEPGPNGKCGVYGPVTSFQTGASGNEWSGNVWTTGGQVRP